MMDIVSARWFSESGVIDHDYSSTIFQQCQMMNPLNQNSWGNHDDHHNFQTSNFPSEKTPTTTLSGSSSVETCHHNKANFEMPISKQQLIKTNTTSNWGIHVLPKPSSSSSSSSQLLSFDNSNSPQSDNYPQHQIYNGNYFGHDPTHKAKDDINIQISPNFVTEDTLENQLNYPTTKPILGTKRSYSITRTPSHAQDHIIAERKRREKLSQRFIALSATIPGLKKMDKASVLGDALKYLKQLQERVKFLEEQNKRRTVESVVLVKKYQVSSHHDASSSDENSDEVLPEIEARVSEKDVLIRIHCDKHKGLVVTILSEVEKLGLFVVSSSVLPLGNSILHITIIAQMEKEFNMTVKELAQNLRLALSKIK